MTDLEKIIEIVTKHYGEWEQNPTRMENGYQYESTFASMTQKMEKAMLEVTLGEIPISRNNKKNCHKIWNPRRSQKSCLKQKYREFTNQ
jgi:hypothetical protein